MKFRINIILMWLLVLIFNIVICSQAARAESPESDFAFDPITGTITAYLGTGGKVEIPSSIGSEPVKVIGYSAFKDCTSLTGVKIPEGVTSIGEWAFENCTSLTSVSISEGMRSIGAGAFKNCSSLSKITMPKDVESIEKWTFESCTSLTKVNIPEGVKSIEAGVFKNCTSLRDVTIPEDAVSIGRWAFENCTSLSSIKIPSAVTCIEAGVFKNCTALSEVTIPEAVVRIEGWAFENCTSLAAIIIPEEVTSIEAGAFYNCILLSDVNIPKSVTNIGDLAFYSCSSLASAYFKGDAPTNFGGYVFDLTASGFTIYAKYGCGFTEPLWNGYNCILSKHISIDVIIDAVKQAIADGTLVGNGKPAEGKADLFLKKLEDVKVKIEQGEKQAAVNNLNMIYAFVDGQASQKDLVVGEASENIASMILELIQEIKTDI